MQRSNKMLDKNPIGKRNSESISGIIVEVKKKQKKTR